MNDLSKLYKTRMLLNAIIFNNEAFNYDAHKSKKWYDENGSEVCDDDWFIVMAELPQGQISFHYSIEFWDYFKIPIKNICNKFDGHDTTIVNRRLSEFLMNN